MFIILAVICIIGSSISLLVRGFIGYVVYFGCLL